MIDQEKITLEWINKVSSTNRDADKILVEKAIRAFLLLEGLEKTGLPFVFKGGTALMLHFRSAKRLSIDIDIILPESPENIDELLDEVVNRQGFLRKELQHRDVSTKIKKEHYKFIYTPIHKSNKEEENVLLDILFEAINYSKIIKLPIQTSFLPEDTNPLSVNVPSLEDLLGDKLTAFAPNTTGIPYFKKDDGMSMEIIKQLYDVGNLFDFVADMKTIKTTFRKFVTTELVYREKDSLTVEDVLDDIYQTALCIVTRGSDGRGDFAQLQAGIRRIGGFIFSESYHIEKAIAHASKAAWLATMIKYDTQTIEKYANPMEIGPWTLTATINPKLNRLKKSNPEAFFYWYKIFKTMNDKML